MIDAQDGGPAFPHSKSRGHLRDYLPGMSLRDWFAGQALAGLHANPNNTGDFNQYASDAYDSADAMLAARKAEAV